MSRLVLVIILLAAVLPPAVLPRPHQAEFEWQAWNAELFARAAKENKYILLDLEAVWCHWCHVMDQTTYADRKIGEYIEANFLPVKVDHDARPDLAQRYRDYGWPATIILKPDGTEIIKRAGYIPPESMLKLLKGVVNVDDAEKLNQQAENNYSRQAFLSKQLKQKLEKQHRDSFDSELGGLKINQKFLDRDSVEWAMHLAASGHQKETQRARKTLDAALALIDPVWGGVYQYSTFGDWEHPHYEKIMQIQAEYLRIYALAGKQFNEPRYLEAARKIADYLFEFLQSDDGAFYVSQDADLVQGKKSHDYFKLNYKARRKLGMPRVDKHIYASTNGAAIEALATLYEMSGEQKYLQQATRAANWILQNRSLPGGGFRHDKQDVAGPYLADNLAMGRALLHLYRVTGERRWLELAAKSGDFIDTHFHHPQAGVASATDNGTPIKPLPQIDENISAARFLNLLAEYSGSSKHKKLAEHIMRYLSTDSVALARLTEAGILLANYELSHTPAHYTVVAKAGDDEAQALHHIAFQRTGWFKRIDWWDPALGEAFNPDVTYPAFPRAAGFVCADGRCSLPAFTTDAYSQLISDLAGS